MHLNAFHKGGSINIEISDDGKGLDKHKLLEKARSKGLVDPTAVLTDEQIYELIFLPGFSTAAQTTDLSGRGVGMDVVRRNIKELGGSVELKTELGKGTKTTITLPLTLAIVDGQSVGVGQETYIVPLVTIIESLQLKAGASSEIYEHGEVFSFRGEYLPIIRLHEVFGVAPRSTQLHEGLIMIVEGGWSPGGSVHRRAARAAAGGDQVDGNQLRPHRGRGRGDDPRRRHRGAHPRRARSAAHGSASGGPAADGDLRRSHVNDTGKNAALDEAALVARVASEQIDLALQDSRAAVESLGESLGRLAATLAGFKDTAGQVGSQQTGSQQAAALASLRAEMARAVTGLQFL